MAPAVLAGVALAGTAMSAIGQLKQAGAQSAAGEYNAKIAEQQAGLARQQSVEEERKFRIQSQKQLGSMRAGYGASGVTLEGSPLDVLAESAKTAEFDALTIRQGGKVKEQQYMAEARLQRKAGQSAFSGALIGAAGSLLAQGAKSGVMAGSGSGGASQAASAAAAAG